VLISLSPEPIVQIDINIVYLSPLVIVRWLAMQQYLKFSCCKHRIREKKDRAFCIPGMIAIAFLTGSCPKADTNGVFSDNDA
jgi:hypothetical protein